MVFINCCNITDRVYRREGGGVGEKPKVGNTIHSETNSSIVSSVEHRNCHSQPVVDVDSLTHHVALLVPLSGSIDPVVDHRGFTGSAKDKWDFNYSCAIRTVFANPVTYSNRTVNINNRLFGQV